MSSPLALEASTAFDVRSSFSLDQQGASKMRTYKWMSPFDPCSFLHCNNLGRWENKHANDLGIGRARKIKPAKNMCKYFPEKFHAHAQRNSRRNNVALAAKANMRYGDRAIHCSSSALPVAKANTTLRCVWLSRMVHANYLDGTKITGADRLCILIFQGQAWRERLVGSSVQVSPNLLRMASSKWSQIKHTLFALILK